MVSRLTIRKTPCMRCLRVRQNSSTPHHSCPLDGISSPTTVHRTILGEEIGKSFCILPIPPVGVLRKLLGNL
jgi:hypothetical protein